MASFCISLTSPIIVCPHDLFIVICDKLIRFFFICTSILVSSGILQGLWSFVLAVVDVYALMVKRSLRNRRVVRLFAVGDVVSHIMPFFMITESVV